MNNVVKAEQGPEIWPLNNSTSGTSEYNAGANHKRYRPSLQHECLEAAKLNSGSSSSFFGFESFRVSSQIHNISGSLDKDETIITASQVFSGAY